MINAAAGTAAMVRVLIESRDKSGHEWTTTGVSANLIDASWLALVDAIEYKLFKSFGRQKTVTKKSKKK